MDKAANSDLEIAPLDGLEVAPQAYKNKHYMGGGGSNHLNFGQSGQSNQPQAKSQGRSKAIWVIAIVSAVCLAVGLGVGLGVGLASQHNQSSSSDVPIAGTEANGAPVTITQTSNASITVTESDSITIITSTPATLPPPICPAANGSTYIATNKPLPTFAPRLQVQITETSLSFEILCNTNFVGGTLGGEFNLITDLSLITNVSTLNDCLDACALYNFQVKVDRFPAFACTGVAWGNDVYQRMAGYQWSVCWLKSNVTLESSNGTVLYQGYHGAVLLNI